MDIALHRHLLLSGACLRIIAWLWQRVRASYRTQYLASAHWKRVREWAYERAGGRCEGCERELNGVFDVHHRHYRSLGCEMPGDVACVCRHCHEGVENAVALDGLGAALFKRPTRTRPIGRV